MEGRRKGWLWVACAIYQAYNDRPDGVSVRVHIYRVALTATALEEDPALLALRWISSRGTTPGE